MRTTRLRWFWRKIIRYLTGRRWTVPLPRREAAHAELMQAFLGNVIPFLAARRKSNRAPLTGMVVALTAGPNLPPYSGWERYRSSMRSKRSYARGVPVRLVGRPVVYESGANKTRVGMTEFIPEYVPRKEQLAARRKLPALQTLEMP